MHWEQRFEEMAALHEGLIAKFHLPDIDCDSRHWWRARRSGRWLPVGDRVIRSAAAPMTDGQRALAAVLDASPGGVLHGPSALAWVGIRGYDLRQLHVARARNLSSAGTTLARLHELRALRAHDVWVVRGVATETALRAIWCEAARYAPKRLYEIGLERIGKLLDQAHRMDLVTWAALHEMVDDIHERGRSGTVIMRALAQERPPGSSCTESDNEDQFELILREAGERGFRRQRVLGGHEPIGRADYSDEELPLASEVNSLRFHTAPTDRASDERRYQALIDAGFTVAVVWDVDLWSNRRGVIDTVRIARHHASLGHRYVIHSPGCPWTPPLLGAPPCS
jgi:hypothetical protein